MVWRSGLAGAGLIGVVALLGCTEPPPDAEAAACAMPTVSVHPASAVAGAEVVVTGENFLEGCPDRSDQRGTVAVAADVVPYTGVQIHVLDDGSPVTVAVVDADDDGTFEVSVPVPAIDPGVTELTTDVHGTESTELVIGIS